MELSDYQDTDAREKNKGFLVEYSFTRNVFSVEFLTEEIEQVLDEKWKFEYRAKSNWIALSRKFGLSRICYMDQNKRLAKWNVLRRQKISHGDIGWRNHNWG